MRVTQRRASKCKQVAGKKPLNPLPAKYLSLQGEGADHGVRRREDGIPSLHVFLEAILALYGKRVEKFRPLPPPPGLRRWIRRATRRQLQGALMVILATLRDGGK